MSLSVNQALAKPAEAEEVFAFKTFIFNAPAIVLLADRCRGTKGSFRRLSGWLW